jgi:hypothetical protein
MGAGAPSWRTLVQNLSGAIPDFADTYNRYRQADTADTLVTQYIYTRYMDKKLADLQGVGAQFRNQTAQIHWHNAIRQEIYRDVPASLTELIATHPYIRELAELCLKCTSTITFNFDNLLDQVAISLTPAETLPPKTTWSLPPIEKVNFPYIYHINGLLPQNERMKTSPKLVFTEDSFLQLLSNSPTANSNITSSFINNTFLLIGLSMADNSLKSILFTNSERSPGSIHYMVHWIEEDDSLSAEQQKDITRFNFSTYGLVTIFLTSTEIREFLSLIQTGTELRGKEGTADEDFRDALSALCGRPINICFKYYIVGPVASGKSTLLENLRTFRTIEEWPEATIPLLYQDHKDLRPEERPVVDSWVYRQLRLKNLYFNRAEPGLHIMDRAPLDLFAFSISPEENRRKAQEVLDHVNSAHPLASGEILLLETDADELLERQLKRGRIPKSRGGVAYDKGGLQEQANVLRSVYPSATKFVASKTTPQALAKAVLWHLLFEDYTPTNLVEIVEAEAVRHPDQEDLFPEGLIP